MHAQRRNQTPSSSTSFQHSPKTTRPASFSSVQPCAYLISREEHPTRSPSSLPPRRRNPEKVPEQASSTPLSNKSARTMSTAVVDRPAPVLSSTRMSEASMSLASTDRATPRSVPRSHSPAPSSARMSTASMDRSFAALGRHSRFSTASMDRSSATLGSDPRTRRVFLPVAPSFVRKLNVIDDASSVDSGDDRRYSDVPSMGTLPLPSRSAPPLSPEEQPFSASFATPAPIRPQPVHPIAEPMRAPRRTWRRLFGSRGDREPRAPREKLGDRRVRVDDVHDYDASMHISNVEDDLPESRPATPPRSRALDPLRWATLACLPKNRAARARRNAARLEERTEHADRRDECDHSNASSFARLPKTKTCGSCGSCGGVDPLNEPNSFAGFRTRPWYLFPEGSSISSGDWDGSVNGGVNSSGSGSRRSGRS